MKLSVVRHEKRSLVCQAELASEENKGMKFWVVRSSEWKLSLNGYQVGEGGDFQA